MPTAWVWYVGSTVIDGSIMVLFDLVCNYLHQHNLSASICLTSWGCWAECCSLKWEKCQQCIVLIHIHWSIPDKLQTARCLQILLQGICIFKICNSSNGQTVVFVYWVREEEVCRLVKWDKKISVVLLHRYIHYVWCLSFRDL